MVTDRKTDFESYAKRAFAAVLETKDYERIYEAAAAEDPRLKDVLPTTFGEEYLCARLALGVYAWMAACREHGIEDTVLQKTFLKVVMEAFHSEKFLKLAEIFSQYLYSSDESIPALPRMAAHMHSRLKIASSVSKSELSGSFKIVAAALEGFKVSFENYFFDFLNSVSGGG